MKKFLAILLVFVLVFSLVSCSRVPQQAETAPPHDETAAPEPAADLDIFIHNGKAYDIQGNPLDNYTVDANRNVLDLDGKVVISGANARELTAPMAFEKILWDDIEVLNKDAEELTITLIARTTVNEDGSYEPFRDEYTVQVFLDDPDADFKEVDFSHDAAADSGDIYKFIMDAKDEDAIKVVPENGAFTLTFVVTGPGEQQMILTNAFDEEICRIKLIVVLPQPTPEEQPEELGSEQGSEPGDQQESNPGSQQESGHTGEISVEQTPAPTPAQPQPTVVPLCNHNWEPVYEYVGHPAEYETIHHDAVYETQQVYVVDQQKETGTEESVTYWCARCGQTYVQYEHGGLSYSAAHSAIVAHCLECNSNYLFQVGTHTYTIQEEQGHYEQQQVCVQAAYDEEVQTHAAWGEDVLTGYRCSICGARKSA